MATLPYRLSADDATDWTVVSKRADDVVSVEHDDKELRLVIHSPSGISQATVQRAGAHWPRRVNVRLRLKGLESLKLQLDKLRLEASVSSHDGSTRQWIAGHEDMPLIEGHRYWIPIRLIDSHGQPTKSLPLKDGWIEFTLPPTLLETNPAAISIQWIDYYRN